MSAADALPREEMLRSSRGLRGSPALPLSAWRGASGRRYVVGVHSAQSFELDEAEEAVCFAVERGTNGIARLISVATSMGLGDAERWLRKVRKAGATEIHVHRLCDSAAERAAVAADLSEG